MWAAAKKEDVDAAKLQHVMMDKSKYFYEIFQQIQERMEAILKGKVLDN